MKIPGQNKAEQLFAQFCEGYKKRDLSFLLSLFTHNTNMWGTGIDEYRVGLKQIEDQLKRDWRQAEASEIEIVQFIPTGDEALWAGAICNAKLTVEGKDYYFEHLRGTIIIDQEEKTWKISHMHCSFPDYRNAKDGSFPVS